MQSYDHEQIRRIIVRELTDGITPAERATLDGWIAQNPANAEAYERIRSGRSREWFDSFYAGYDPDATLRGVGQRVSRRVRRRWAAALCSSAAVVAVAVMTLLYTGIVGGGQEGPTADPGERYRAVMSVDGGEQIALSESGGETEWQQRLQTETPVAPQSTDDDLTVRVAVPRWSEYRLRLDDGTLVWLNSETIIEYPRTFGQQERRVSLTGEAYFEVAPDAARPFTVELAGDAEVTALGTSFNISAYETDNAIAATLVTGSVRVTAAGAETLLVPGQQAIIGGGLMLLREVNAQNYISWTQGVFEFRNMTLDQICTRLARWYDVEFEFEGGAGQERFTGAAMKYQPLRTFLQDIEQVTDVRFRFDGNTVTVSNKD